MNCGEKIAELRKTHGMTQVDLGKAMNVSYQAVSKWERNESQPDFETMSKIAKLFDVPLGYFVGDGETQASAPTSAPVQKTLVGTCTECGKAVYEGEAWTVDGKIVCADCAQRIQAETLERQRAAQQAENLRKDKEEFQRKQLEAEMPRIERELKWDARKEFLLSHLGLVLGVIAAVAVYVILAINMFGESNFGDQSLYAFIMFLAPIGGCAVVYGFVNNIIEFFTDTEVGYKLKGAMIIAACFAVVNLAMFTTMYCLDNNIFYMILLIAGTLVAFTFMSQFLWGGVVQDIFTCGGFTFKLPGIIFSLSPDGIIMLIVTKVFLGILALIVYVVTTVIFAVAAMVGSVFTFIPSLLLTIRKEKTA